MPIVWLWLTLLLTACADDEPPARAALHGVTRVRPALQMERMEASPRDTMRSAAPEAALDDPDAAERERAVLDYEGDLTALARLATDDPSTAVRRAAVQRLADAESPAERAALRRTLADPDPGVLSEAILALAASGDTLAVPALERLQGHRDAEVRALAGEALETLRP